MKSRYTEYAIYKGLPEPLSQHIESHPNYDQAKDRFDQLEKMNPNTVFRIIELGIGVVSEKVLLKTKV